MIIIRPYVNLEPPVIVGSTLVTNTSTVNSSTISVPTHQAGDLLLLIVSSRNSISSTPSGYTQVLYTQNTDRFLMVLQKVATSSEPSSVSVTISDNTRHQVDMLSIRGGGVDAFNSSDASSGAVTTPTLVVPNSNSLVLRIGMIRSSATFTNFTWPSPLIEISDHGAHNALFPGIFVSIAYDIVEESGSVPAIAPSISSSTAWAAATIAIGPV